jgi:hypothetical protein
MFSPTKYAPTQEIIDDKAVFSQSRGKSYPLTNIRVGPEVIRATHAETGLPLRLRWVPSSLAYGPHWHVEAGECNAGTLEEWRAWESAFDQTFGR